MNLKKLLDLVARPVGKRPGSTRTAKGSFPEGPERVPYPNPHPDAKDGCFPEPPKPEERRGW
jgi:hypothetical protein